jgi:hypothetical protein
VPRGLRLAILAGLGLALTGILGLALTVGQGPEAPLRPVWFVPLYAAGSLLLIGSGIWWLVVWTRRRPGEPRHAPPPTTDA